MHPWTFRLKSGRHEVAGLASWADQFSVEIGLVAPLRGELQVILEEVALNIITHGYGEAGEAKGISVTLDSNERFITIVVEDEARAFDPTGRVEVDVSLPPGERPIGGLGVHLVKNLVESMHYERRGARNILTLRLGRDRPRPD
jgi:anti-sigma regulatory factor (Ser/Thr protein kinase)